jgi:hypothetical protein
MKKTNKKTSQKENENKKKKHGVNIKNKNKNQNIINIKINTNKRRNTSQNKVNDYNKEPSRNLRTEIITHYSTPQLQNFQQYMPQTIKEYVPTQSTPISLDNKSDNVVLEQYVPKLKNIDTPFKSLDGTPNSLFTPQKMNESNLMDNYSNYLSKNTPKPFQSVINQLKENFVKVHTKSDHSDNENILNTLNRNNIEKINYEKRFEEYKKIRMEVEGKNTYTKTKQKFNTIEMLDNEINKLKNKVIMIQPKSKQRKVKASQEPTTGKTIDRFFSDPAIN